MPIQLTIQYKNGETENRELDNAPLTIGRHRRNNVILATDEVSREHARIDFREGKPYFSCQGKFGATLNGRQLAAEETPQLQAGDRIEICGHTLTVQESEAPTLIQSDFTQQAVPAMAAGANMRSWDVGSLRPASGTEAVVPAKTQLPARTALRNRYSTDLMNEALMLAKELDMIYRNNVTEVSLVRRQKLKEALKGGLSELNETGREEMLELLRERFGTRDETWKRLIRQDNELRAQRGKVQATKTTLESLAQNLMEKARPFQSDTELSRFGENLQQVVVLFLTFFRDLEANRRENFKLEEESNTLAVQSSTPLQEIGELLLDWGSEGGGSKARDWLESRLQKLRAHEKALAAGYTKGLDNVCRQVFERLNPETFERQVRREKLKFKIFQKLLGPLFDWRCWRRYKKEFQELQKQQRTTVQAWFQEEFDRTYRRQILEPAANLESDGKKS